jgi:cell division protein FtsL
MDRERENVTKMESRWVAFLTAIALAFGGIWLQNQYDATLRLQQQMADFMRHVDDKYVQKDFLQTVTERLGRIENKVDDIANEVKSEPRKYSPHDERLGK